MGKTTIWQAVTATASSLGFRVLVSRPVEAEAKLAFAGLVDLLEPVADIVIAGLPLAQARALEVALRRMPPRGRSPDGLTISIATLGALRSLSSDGPVLIAIDDVQWLDSPTARALRFAVRRLTSERIGLLVTQRTTPEHGVAAAAAEVTGEGNVVIEIGPMDVETLEELLRDRLGVGFLRPTLLRIEQASGGNPFYALEIGRELLRRGIRFAPDVLPIPEKLSDIVRDRIASLSEPAAEATLLAAVMASPTEEKIRAAMGRDGRSDEGIAEAIQAGLLERDGERLRFGHPLFASIAYESADAADRRIAHARAARVLTEPEERARHLALASDRKSEHVASALERAAHHAAERGATEAAAQLAELAWHRTPARRPDDARRRALTAAEHLFRAGDPLHARGLLEVVLVSTRQGRARAEVLVALAESYAAGDWNVRIRLLEEATVEAPDGSARIVAERLLGGAALTMLGDAAGASRHVRAALRFAERADDVIEIALSLAMICRVEARATGTIDRGLLTRAVALESALTGVHVVARPSYAVATLIHARDGGFDEARRLFEAFRHEALRIGDWDALPAIAQ